MKVFFATITMACMLAGCGGAGHGGASSASTSSASVGAASLAGDMPNDLTLEIDLAGMRNDKTLSTVLTKAEASAEPGVTAFLDRLDRIDVRAGRVDGKVSGVGVLWGRFPKDPGELAYFHAGSGHEVEAAAPLESGVREFADPKDPDDHLFAVSDTVWVVATGPAAETVRTHFAKQADAPAQPQGALLHLIASAPMLASPEDIDKGPLKGMDHAEVTLESGMSSFKLALTFKDDDSAGQAQAKVQMLSGLLLAAAASKAKDCVALTKLGVDVKRDGKDVGLSITGIGDAAASWDPASCPKLEGNDSEAVAAAPPPPAKESGEGKHKRPKKIPAHSK